jgi:hypothetical protein
MGKHLVIPVVKDSPAHKEIGNWEVTGTTLIIFIDEIDFDSVPATSNWRTKAWTMTSFATVTRPLSYSTLVDIKETRDAHLN